jgi:hypothetical protein
MLTRKLLLSFRRQVLFLTLRGYRYICTLTRDGG